MEQRRSTTKRKNDHIRKHGSRNKNIFIFGYLTTLADFSRFS
jgi:hypothetical protein